jgi:hypothetical protein
MILLIVLDVHEFSYKGNQSGEISFWFAFKDLVDIELLVILLLVLVTFSRSDVIRFRQCAFMIIFISQTVDFEPELLFNNGVSEMCSLHVIISHRDRDDEVDVKVIDHIGNQTKSDN